MSQPYAPFTPPQPPARKRRRWPWIVAGILAVLIGIPAIIGGTYHPAPTASPVPQVGIDAPQVPDTTLYDQELASAQAQMSTAQAELQSAVPVPTTHTVVYTITGRSAGTITYSSDGGGQSSQVTDAGKLPWSKTISVPDSSFTFLYISAQNAGSGTISCSITEDGQVVKQNSSSGLYAIVDCSTS